MPFLPLSAPPDNQQGCLLFCFVFVTIFNCLVDFLSVKQKKINLPIQIDFFIFYIFSLVIFIIIIIFYDFSIDYLNKLISDLINEIACSNEIISFKDKGIFYFPSS